MDNLPAIVIDNGSYKLKGGFSGKFVPNYSIDPKIISKQKVFNDVNNWDWNGVERLYCHLLFDKLHINDDTKYNFLITQQPFTNNITKKKITELVFEKFNGKGLFLGMTATLSLYANGLTTGCVIDSGYKNTYITPVFEGYMFSLFTKKLNYGGCTLDNFLKDLLQSKSKNITLQDAETIKKRFCYAALDFVEEENKATQKLFISGETYKLSETQKSIHSKGSVQLLLPDGNELKAIDVHAERFQSVEIMFQPHLYAKLDKSEKSIPFTVHQSISCSDFSLHRELFNSIVLSGGNTIIPGLKERITKEVSHLAPASNAIKVYASPQRGYSAWSGGSLLAGQDQMKDVWITPELYDEIGVESLIVR